MGLHVLVFIFSVLLPLSLTAAEDNEGPGDDVFFYDVQRPVKVVLWTHFFQYDQKWLDHHAPNCVVGEAFRKYVTTTNNVVTDPLYDISDADVLVINLSALGQNNVLPAKKPPGQLWVATCWEATCKLLQDPATMAKMDGVASYDPASDYPSYYTPPPEDVLRRPVPDFGARGDELATYSSSDCRAWFQSERSQWFQAINASLAAASGTQKPVLSFGACFHNAEEPPCQPPEAVVLPPADREMRDGTLDKYTNRCSSRPFALVAENSFDVPWYVTEKIWNALAAGAVPVYAGPAEVSRLIPPNSALLASDYENPGMLARAVAAFGSKELDRLHAWKELPVTQWGGWQKARRLSRATLAARLCEAASARPSSANHHASYSSSTNHASHGNFTSHAGQRRLKKSDPVVGSTNHASHGDFTSHAGHRRLKKSDRVISSANHASHGNSQSHAGHRRLKKSDRVVSSTNHASHGNSQRHAGHRRLKKSDRVVSSTNHASRGNSTSRARHGRLKKSDRASVSSEGPARQTSFLKAMEPHFVQHWLRR